MKVQVLSVATHRERMIDVFEESCSNLGYQLQLLGVGERWRGFSWRFDLIKNALEKLDSGQVVVVCDAFDTVMLQPASTLLDRFTKHNTDLLFTTEPSDFHPLVRYYRWRLFGKNIVNGGTYLGYAGAMLDFIKSLKYTHSTDDQRLLSIACSGLSIDTEYSIAFHCPLLYRGELPKIKPCLISFPGNGEQHRFMESLQIQYTFQMTKLLWCHMWYNRLRHVIPFFLKELVTVAILFYFIYKNT